MGFLCTAIITWITVGVPVWSQDSFYFFPQPSDLDAVEGRSATLECGVSNPKHIVFYWMLNDEKLYNTTRRHQQGSNLHITRVDPQHDLGEFRCVATNVSTGISLVSQAAQINILWISDDAWVILQKQQSTLKEGGIMVLQCKVDGYPSVHVEWYRNGERLFRSETVTLKNKKLELSQLSLEDNGVYSCRAANDVGSTESMDNYPLILTSKEVARIVEVPKSLIAPKNGTARFDCAYDNAEKVSWYVHGDKTPLVTDTRITIYVNQTLHISSVQEKDEGIYLCTAVSASNSSAPKQTYSAQLKLAYISKLNQNNFEPRPRENGIMAAPQGGPFEVTCIAPSAKPKPTVIWLDPDGHIVSDTGNKRVDDSRLIIEAAKESDVGNYTCTAENLAGTTEATVALYVTVPPVITSKADTLVVNEGEPATLSCDFVSSPFPLTTVHWLKDKKYIRTSTTQHLLSHDGTLQITNVQLSDAGAYICEVNTTGFDPIQSSVTTLNVKEKLKFVPPPVNKNLELNSNAKIYCKARGVTAPVVKWMKEGRRTFDWPPHIKDENGTLHFNTVRADDAGRYTCIATNSQGLINTTIKVDVIVLPKFEVPPADTEAYEGYSAMIHCRATGDPLPTIQWDKNNVLSGFDSSRFVVMQNGSLFIKDVHVNDQGKYGCTAGNSGGFKRAEMSLTVKGPEDNYLGENGQDYKTSGSNTMTKTVMITLGAAAVYMTLVIGLMIWCRFRRARRKALMLTNASTEAAKAEDGEGATEDAETKAKCGNGDCQDGGMCNKSDGELQSSGSHHSKRSRTSYDKLQFPHSDLQMMMLLGSGEYGDVYLSKASGIIDGEAETVVMVKLLQTRDENVHFEYKHEMEMFHKIQHCNVAGLLGICRDSDPFMMILEYTDWGDLKQFLLATRKDHSNAKVKPSPLSVGEAIGVCHQVALGMENLSNHRFIHKDLATRNCLISSKLNVKVSCPSLSKDTYAQEYYNFHNRAVPLRWAPAEAVLEDEWSTKSDVWSFAVLVWEVFNQAEIPFKDKSDEKVLQMLKKQQIQWHPPSGAPEPLCVLLTQCWNQSPKDRPSFSEIVLQTQSHVADNKV